MLRSGCLWVLAMLPLLQVGCTKETLGPRRVSISVVDDGFKPGPFLVGLYTGDAVASLSEEKPAALEEEPAYQGDTQLYGCFQLGTAEPRSYYFCLDVLSESDVKLYFDVNHNGNLFDDDGPVENQGTGLFAATIGIPFNQLVPEVPFTTDFKLWVFTNDSLWPRKRVMRYSRTSLEGPVSLGAEEYTAYLIDHGGNDADLTNDGVCIDLDRDRRIDPRIECFPSDEVVEIRNQEYVFHICW
jgi:hypothetical protein